MNKTNVRTKPTVLNFTLLTAAVGLNLLALYTASHAPLWALLPAALLFSLSNNTVFSLLHECVHGSFAGSAAVNRAAGRLAACWFPTGFSVQKAFHLQHHRNNRSESEQFDILHPQDVRWLKYAQWYAIYTGIYWLMGVLGYALYAVTPRAVRQLILRAFGRQGAAQSGADSYIGVLDRLPPVITRAEIWAAWAFQAALFVLLDLNAAGWLACYAAFALQWSSLQYTDHAFSPLDRRNGAWNLIVPRWVRLFFLNYHYHLAHHQHPEVSWRDLPRYAEYGVRFSTVWRHCLHGPKPLDRLPEISVEPLRENER